MKGLLATFSIVLILGCTEDSPDKTDYTDAYEDVVASLSIIREGNIVEFQPLALNEAKLSALLDNLLEKGLIEVTESAGDEADQPAEAAAIPEKTETETVEEELAPAAEIETGEIELQEEDVDEINLTEMEEDEEELEEKTRIEVSAVEEKAEAEATEVAEADQQGEEKTDLSGIFDEPEAESTAVAEEEAEPAAEEAAPAADDLEMVTGKKIMVIDDSIVIRKMIEIALEEENYHLINATSGKEGMDSFEKDQPDLVILDMMLPDMNGIDLLKKIKEKGNTPVIMLSGKDSPQLVENAKEVGVNDFLPKPFKDDELVEKVKNLIN